MKLFEASHNIRNSLFDMGLQNFALFLLPGARSQLVHELSTVLGANNVLKKLVHGVHSRGDGGGCVRGPGVGMVNGGTKGLPSLAFVLHQCLVLDCLDCVVWKQSLEDFVKLEVGIFEGISCVTREFVHDLRRGDDLVVYIYHVWCWTPALPRLRRRLEGTLSQGLKVSMLS